MKMNVNYVMKDSLLINKILLVWSMKMILIVKSLMKIYVFNARVITYYGDLLSNVSLV